MTTTPHSEDKLLVAMELSNSKWLMAYSNGEKIRRKSIDARDRSRFMQELKRAKEKLGMDPAQCRHFAATRQDAMASGYIGG